MRLSFLCAFMLLCRVAAADALSEANAYYRAGRYDEAIARYGDAQANNPDPAIIHFNLGAAQYRKGKYDEALAAYERAATTTDLLLEAKARYNMGNCHYRQGRLIDALECYRRTIDLLSAEPNLGSEGKKVLADAQANYEFVQNKIKEESKLAQQQPQKQGQQKHQQQSAEQKQEQQQPTQKDKQDKEKQEQKAQAVEKQEEQKSSQESKDDKDKAQKAALGMTREEAARLLDAFGQIEVSKKIEDKFHADEPRPAKDW